MTTFKEYLTEAEVKDIVELLTKNCQPFLTASKNGYLLRGVKGLNDTKYANHIDGQRIPYFIKKVRNDRKPIDTTNAVHHELDDWFLKNFGFRARSNAMFAKGAKTGIGTLSQYGAPCVVFPIGPIKYVWTSHIGDLFVALPFSLQGEKLPDGHEKIIDDWLKEQKYIDTGMDKACKSRDEIMVNCSSYYAIELDFLDQIQEALDAL